MHHPLALITGASLGIGPAVALRLAEAGYDIALTSYIHTSADSSPSNSGNPGIESVVTSPGSPMDSLAEIRRLAEAHGVSCCCFFGDIGEPGVAAGIVDALGEEGYGIELLINNYSLTHSAALQDTSWEEWQRILRTNLTGCYAICHEVIPGMIWNHRGKILNITSCHGASGSPADASCLAVAESIHALTRALSAELAPSGIQVNAIASGDEPPISPEDAADLALRVITAGDYLTGQILRLDGRGI